jgi:TatD DNase family protein
MDATASLWDTHAHLDFPEFAEDLDGVVQRATAAGVGTIVSIATDLASARRAIALAERFPRVFAAAGWHPGHAEEAPDDFRGELRALAKHPKVAAIGECGLDYYRLPSKSGGDPAADEAIKARQARVFQQQLEVAADLGLGLVIHTRDSFEDTLAQMLPFSGRIRAVFHCFSEGVEEMRRVVAEGHLVSFTGILTFKNAARLREVAAATPQNRFMVETDCPFLAPVPHRGKRCEPAHVAATASALAAVRETTLAEIAEASTRTATGFFRPLG